MSFAGVIQALHRRKIPQYLINLVVDYFTGRVIEDGRIKHKTTAGIPQGSVLGPLLWNIFYDPVLTLTYPDGVVTVGYADDLAAVITAPDSWELNQKIKETLNQIQRWMENNNLKLALEKTEFLVLNGRRDRSHLTIDIGGITIKPSKFIKYLGCHIGENMRFGQHIDKTVKKTESKINSLSRIMPNMGGPNTQKRLLLYGVAQSMLAYTAEIWADWTNLAKYKNMLVKAQRKVLIRVACSYRTVSSEALQVVCGIAPIELTLREGRRHRFYRQKRGTPTL